MVFDRPSLAWVRVRSLVVLVVCIAMAWLALEALLFRSGAYLQIVNLSSNVGSTMRALKLLEHQCVAGQRTVLLLGDSRITEGVSTRQMAAWVPGLRVVNLGIPGSSPRTWAYLLREAGRRGCQYEAAVALMPPQAQTHGSDWSDRPLDIRHVQPLLGLADVGAYQASYSSEALARIAARSILLPALGLRDDIRDLLRAPYARYREVRWFHRRFVEAADDYDARPERMPDLVFQGALEPVDWAGLPDATQRLLRDNLSVDRRPLDGRETPTRDPMDGGRAPIPNRVYLDHWLCTLAREARAQGARLAVAAIPRGPYHGVVGMPLQPDSVVEALASEGVLDRLDPEPVRALEQPALFADPLHLNTAGRARMSELLSRQLGAWLGVEVRP